MILELNNYRTSVSLIIVNWIFWREFGNFFDALYGLLLITLALALTYKELSNFIVRVRPKTTQGVMYVKVT